MLQDEQGYENEFKQVQKFILVKKSILGLGAV